MQTYAERVMSRAINKELQERAAKCEGLWFEKLETYTPGLTRCIMRNPLTDYDDWNNVMRIRDLAIKERGGAYSRWIFRVAGDCVESATKEQIVEAAVKTLMGAKR